MELELVSLPCQTVNSLGAATRAINPLLVLQFSTQPRTAINNRPLSKVDQPSSISRGFPEVSEIPFSVIIIFFPLPSSFYCGDLDFRCPSAGRRSLLILTTTRSQKGDFRPRSRGEGNQSSLIAMTLEFLDSIRLVSESEENARGSTKIPLFDSPFRSFAILDFFDLCWISNVSKDNRNILRRRKNYLDLTYSKIYSNMFVYVCIRVSSCFQRIFFLFSR